MFVSKNWTNLWKYVWAWVYLTLAVCVWLELLSSFPSFCGRQSFSLKPTTTPKWAINQFIKLNSYGIRGDECCEMYESAPGRHFGTPCHSPLIASSCVDIWNWLSPVDTVPTNSPIYVHIKNICFFLKICIFSLKLQMPNARHYLQSILRDNVGLLRFVGNVYCL